MTIPAAWPPWLRGIVNTLPVGAQYAVSGNIRDVHLCPPQHGTGQDDDPSPATTLGALWRGLTHVGFRYVITYDVVAGFDVVPRTNDPAADQAVFDDIRELTGLDLAAAPVPGDLIQLQEVARAVATTTMHRAALVVVNASRISLNPAALDEEERAFYIALEQLSQVSFARVIRRDDGGGGVEPSSLRPRHNPIILLIDRENDVPQWLLAGNDAIRPIAVPAPDFSARLEMANLLAYAAIDPAATDDERRDLINRFAAATNGMSLRSMTEVTRLANDQSIPFSEIHDAVRCYRIGVVDNPWRKSYLREQIKGHGGVGGESAITRRVLGQTQAVTKTLDILKRAALGLSGAQAASASSRPRGVLFFAGPTGVGKTELAKSITELIFGDESAYLRFDMSEFSEEQSEARLIGSPPGYVGHDAGGQLTNAVRQRPFSLVLFDEIEKAHPRILDKFLQVLEDGRLTDGRGATVHFSETLLVFTSNLGTFVDHDVGGVVQRVQNVRAGDPYDEVVTKVSQAIEDHFSRVLNRPELLNRLGDNIVVFGFISPEVAAQIFALQVRNVIRSLADESGIELVLADDVFARIRDACTVDLSQGGRGIGNRVESNLVNPLARKLFDHNIPPGTRVQAVGWSVTDGVAQLELR